MCKAMEDMRNESLQEGMKQGMKQGVKEGMRSSALRMLNAGRYALEEVAEISGLSLEEVTKLQAEREA